MYVVYHTSWRIHTRTKLRYKPWPGFKTNFNPYSKKQNLPLFVIKIMPNTIFCFYVRISLHSQFRVYLNLQIFIVYVNITNQIVSTKFIFIRIKILHIIWIIKTVEKVSNNKLLFLVAGLNVRTLKHIWTARLSALFRVTRLCIIKQT